MAGAVSGIIGKFKGDKQASGANATNATQRLGADVGIPPGRPISSDAIDAALDQTGRVYDAVKQAVGPRVQVTNDFADSLRTTLGKIAADVDVTPELKGPKGIVEAFIRRVTAPDIAKIEGRSRHHAAGRHGSTIEKVAGEQPGPRIANTIEQAAARTAGRVHRGRASAIRSLRPPHQHPRCRRNG